MDEYNSGNWVITIIHGELAVRIAVNPQDTMEVIKCKFCDSLVPAETAHLHQGQYVGNDCCWDERLRTTQ